MPETGYSPNAGDLISEAALAIEMGCDAEDIGLTIHPHPTLSETFAMSAEAFAGTLIDGKTMKNVTSERMQKLAAIKFSDLPLELAVKQVRGDGKRLLATFEDPNCGYCKKLARDTAKLDNVTIYTFLYPILSPDSLDKSNQVWCSSDKAKAWNDWMQDGKALSGKSDCDTSAVQKTVELGHRLSISGTPTLFFADGDRIPGAVPVAQIEKKLDQAQAK